MGTTPSRRDFLRLAAGAVAVAAGGAACSSGSGSGSGADPGDEPTGGPGTGARKAGKDATLRIAQWSHYVPAYDTWFDGEYTKRWGEDHGVEVVVDHIPFAEVALRAVGETAAEGPHDIYGFVDPPAVFEDDVIDHRDIVEEIEDKFGPMTPLVGRSVFNPKTKKYFGVPDYWVANPVHYRVDLWDQVEPGLRPDTWDDLLRAGPRLKALGFPLGIGISSDGDSNYSLLSLLHAFGASVQDADGNPTLDTPATVEAVRLAADLYRTGMTEDVFIWEGFSNNRLLTSGRGSLIVNAVSAVRAAEAQDPALAANIGLLPVPSGAAGPEAPRGVYVTGVNVIWKFSPNQTLARQFLVDLASQQREALSRSGFYNLPAFPGAVPDLPDVLAGDAVSQPEGKYSLLAAAEDWSTNIGHPGHANAAVDEVFTEFVIPKMFAAAARGEMTPEDAVKAAGAQIAPIFAKWRERGKI